MKRIALCLVSVLALGISVGATANAASSTIATWVGAGQEYDPSGKLISSYQVKTTVNENGSSSQSHTVVTAEDGTILNYDMTITSAGNHFAIASNLGQGQGTCFGASVCSSYIKNGDQSYATTVTIDGDVQETVTYVLQNGKLLKILSDKSVRMN